MSYPRTKPSYPQKVVEFYTNGRSEITACTECARARDRQRAVTDHPASYVCPKPLDPTPHLLPQGDDPRIPVIDIELLFSGDASELRRLCSACSDWGFFQAVKHGVSSSLMEMFKKEVKEFFQLSSSEKKKYWQTEEVKEGFGQLFVVSEDQPLDWADTFNITTHPLFKRNPKLFPSLPPHFRLILEEYSMEIKKLSLKIIDFLGQALGEETRNYMNEYFKEKTSQIVRINYYPPCPEPEKAIGLSPHSDGDALTVVLQVNEVEGLQIKKDNHWITVSPLPQAFIVNIGDVMEILSNGVYRSVEHRAVVNRETERLSVAAFHNPDLDLEIGPSPSLLNSKNPARFGRIIAMEYLRGFFSRKLKANLTLKS